MDISWSQLKPKEFEQLCCLILEANEFTDIQWFGQSGNDKGRDVLAKKIEYPLPSAKEALNGLFSVSDMSQSHRKKMTFLLSLHLLVSTDLTML